MINQDTNIKRCTINIQDPATKKLKSYTFTENDVMNIKYKDENNKIIELHGFLLKIGIDSVNKKEYFTVLSYNFGTNKNIHFFYTNQIVQIINISKSVNPYSFGPVYCADESVILMRQNEYEELEISKDGNTWITVSGGGAGSGVGNSEDSSLLRIMKQKGFTGNINDLADMLNELYTNLDDILLLEVQDL